MDRPLLSVRYAEVSNQTYTPELLYQKTPQSVFDTSQVLKSFSGQYSYKPIRYLLAKKASSFT
ncbi:hypothetical protein, partial [Candidatus Hakubella thermalkaliphila]|uniref:hypothetical protein n=1 Tax=Candidatus Hakubella thermalkaliphila TaxID=2754717 RepID=UPI001C611D23